MNDFDICADLPSGAVNSLRVRGNEVTRKQDPTLFALAEEWGRVMAKISEHVYAGLGAAATSSVVA